MSTEEQEADGAVEKCVDCSFNQEINLASFSKTSQSKNNTLKSNYDDVHDSSNTFPSENTNHTQNNTLFIDPLTSVPSEKINENNAESTQACFTIETYSNDGTLDLLSLSCVHPVLATSLKKLINLYIHKYNTSAAKFNRITSGHYSLSSTLFPSDLHEGITNNAYVNARDLSQLSIECRHLVEDLHGEVLELDCIDLDELQTSWGSKNSVRQSRRELIQIYESLCSRIDKIVNYLTIYEKLYIATECQIEKDEALSNIMEEVPTDSVTITTSPVPLNESKQQHKSEVLSSAELSNDSAKTESCNKAKEPPQLTGPTLFHSRWGNPNKIVIPINHTKNTTSATSQSVDTPPNHRVGIVAQCDPIFSTTPRGSNFSSIPLQQDPVAAPIATPSMLEVTDSNSREATKRPSNIINDAGNSANQDFQEEDESRQFHKRNKKKRLPPIDWNAKALEKIKAFKEHTAKGGCVTTLYENPVNRDTLLSLLAKCEPHLLRDPPDQIQIKIAIETFIAGLEIAHNYLKQLRINKAQMKLLYESATILDHLEGPEDLLPELKSLQGLLKTFGMF